MGCPGQIRADFAGGPIANGEDEIEQRRSRSRKHVPAFAPQMFSGNVIVA